MDEAGETVLSPPGKVRPPLEHCRTAMGHTAMMTTATLEKVGTQFRV